LKTYATKPGSYALNVDYLSNAMGIHGGLLAMA
jgi:hypothetical protein